MQAIELLYAVNETSSNAEKSRFGNIARSPIINQSQCSIISQQYIIWPVIATWFNLTTTLVDAGPLAYSGLLSFNCLIRAV